MKSEVYSFYSILLLTFKPLQTSTVSLKKGEETEIASVMPKRLIYHFYLYCSLKVSTFTNTKCIFCMIP